VMFAYKMLKLVVILVFGIMLAIFTIGTRSRRLPFVRYKLF